ncbi:uncharacterized protein PAC_18206 [Phialocephala subalpina]|uniref:6-methylsalicylate decarboxylase n=1 Tax=Phialocephala subalpina TaxID=576137 RepID=A0A1L7XTL0_9HELO|nr:uncharacterized protein PAC_18206 [Phialocephala subalpina]
MLSSIFLLALSLRSVVAHYVVDPSFKLDVHSHVVPYIWRTALIEAGYPVKNGVLYTDGFPVSNWTLDGHIAAMDTLGVNYSTLSVSAPGVNFLAHDPCAAAELAREVNLLMYNYTQTYPERLGAMCLLPLPDVDSALAEIEYCLDVLNFDGVGMYSNFNGTYLGDAALNPVFELLNNRSATVFVHPAAPSCAGAAIGYPDPMSEYPFESVRAMENMLLTGQRANYSEINIIFPHGGGAMPYLGTRIAGMASLSFLGGLSVADSLKQFKNYIFDTASSTTVMQLLAMNNFGGVEKIVVGTDYPYVPLTQASPQLAAIQTNGNYTDAQMALINNQNALSVFPGVATKLGFAISS